MKKDQYVTGFFKSHRLGFGFVKPNTKKIISEVFIPKNATAFAVEGDLVRVKVLGKDSKGYEGEVAEILQRKLKNVAGTVTATAGSKGYLLSPLLGPSKEVEFTLPKKVKLKAGDRIVIQLDSNNSKRKFKGRFKKYLGTIKDPMIDTDVAIDEFALKQDFPADVIQEVRKLPPEIDASAYPDREDLQKLTTFTIDPETAKDYDDAISLEQTKKGHYQLGVHIADVSYFVEEGTALDREAFLRCNSTYFPDRCVSMLPKELADNLCSLKANVPRLTVSTFMTFDSDGQLLNYRITRSIIKSCQRFSYEQVKLILDKKKKHKLYTNLVELEKLALILKKSRKARGCIDLALADSKMVLGKTGIPKAIKKVEYDITHQMIEEFMLKNNEVVARHLSQKEIPIPYRIHEEPKSDNILSFVQMAETLGASLNSPPTQQDLQELFESIKGTSIEHHMSIHFIKCMKLANYNPENIGHYGLQLDYYCHFTSPIRRYVDLVIHRQVFKELKDVNISEIAERCSDQERLSAKAESAVRELKMMRYFKEQDIKKVYPSIVTKVKHFGIFFEIPELLYEGFIHVSDLGNDYFIYDEKKGRFKGERRKSSFEVGKKIKTKIRSINLIQRELEWTTS
ncbi:MAG: Ribonuclease R [Chlamydiae bacterium]|nr:Ribonuclease R [Chlamydiota bacterium]